MKINKLNESMIPSQAILDDCLDDYLQNAFGYNGVEDYVATQYPNHPSEWQSRICDYLKQHKHESLDTKNNKLTENADDEFFEIQDIVGTALNSIGGDMDDITGGITSGYDEDRLLLSLYSTVDRKDARKFKKKFFETIENALSQTRFNEVSADEDRTFAYMLSRYDLHNHMGSDRGDEFASKFAMFEILITAYGKKLEEDMIIGYDEGSIKEQIRILEKNIEDYKQLIVDEPEDRDYWEEQIKKCEEEIADLQSYKPLDEAADIGEEDFIEVSDLSVIDKLDFAGAVEVRGNKVYGDANTLKQLKDAIDNLDEDWTPPENWISHKGAWIYPAGEGYEANFMGQHFEAPTLDELKVKLRDAREHRTHFVGSEKDKQFADNIKKYGRELQEVKLFGAKANKLNEDTFNDYDEDDEGKMVGISFDVNVPSNMKESEIEAIIRKALGATDLDIPGYMEIHTLNESLQEKLTGYKITVKKDGKTFDDYMCAYEEDGAIRQMKNKYGKDIEIVNIDDSRVIKEANQLLPIEVLNSDGTPKQYDVKFMELEKVPGLLNWDVADQLEQHFRNNRLWVDELHYNEVKDCIEYDINWGDWKHEHLRSKWLLEELFKELGIVANINSHTTEEDGSDTYSAHYVVRATGKMNEAITPPTGDDPDLSAIPQIGQEVMYRGKRTTIIDYEQDPEYGYDFLIKNPFWNGEDERFENIWVGDQIDFIDWGPNDIGLQPPG